MNWNIVSRNLLLQKHKNNVVDLGAQVGIYSEFLWLLLGERTERLISVEPHPDNTKKIQDSITRRHAEDTWFIDECLVDVRSGVTDFQYHRTIHDEPAGSLLNDLEWQDGLHTTEKIRVKTKTIQEICPNPDIIKIDVEGAEYQILPEILRLKSVYALIIEFGNIPYPAYEREGYLLEDYLSLLYHKGFTSLIGHSFDGPDHHIIFYPEVTPTMKWQDMPKGYDRGIQVLAQKNNPTIGHVLIKG